LENRIKAFREARGLSLEALAIKARTTNQQISLLEAGKRRLTVDWLLRLSKSLDCHPWEIVSNDLPKPLEPKEILLLSQFRGLKETQQNALMQLLTTLVPRRRVS
jgi:transcriptional regulator with XRE-family HTH domain